MPDINNELIPSKPQFNNSVIQATTRNIKETSQSIITIAESVDHIVNSIEQLVPIIHTVSKEYLNSIKNGSLKEELSTDEKLSRNNISPKEEKQTLSKEQLNQFLESPAVQNIMQSLTKK